MPETINHQKENLTIQQWAEEDRPREKLMQKGRSALTDAELIAILLGSGTKSLSAVDLAKKILSEVQNDLHQLAGLSVKDLTRFRGMGPAKALTLVSALELGRRRKDSDPIKKNFIQSSKDIYEIMRPHLQDIRHEEFWVILTNRANEVIKKIVISTGGINGTVADARLIFKAAVEELASGIILVHNHPSGNKQPSRQDMELTKRLKEGARLLEIHLLDHLIYTDSGYTSFCDEVKAPLKIVAIKNRD